MVLYIVYLLTQAFYGEYDAAVELVLISGFELFIEIVAVVALLVAVFYYKFIKDKA